MKTDVPLSKSAYSIACRWPRWISLVLAIVLFSLILISANTGTALLDDRDVTFSKAFAPDTIGPGSTTTLLFTITNVSGSPVTTLAFTDTLPAGITLASPAGAVTTCSDGILDAPDGGGTITFSGGRLGPNGSCIVTVNVTSSTPGTHANASGDLTSSAGNHGPAADDLNVVTDRPGFSKSFSPSSIPPGGTSTLTFLIDNTANGVAAASLGFIDNLPVGLLVASPANASTTCTGGTLIAVAGTGTISYSGGSVGAGSSCTVSVDVTASDFGEYHNVSLGLTTMGGVSGFATAALEIPHNPLIKSFTDDPVPPGGTVTLEFTVTNFDRSDTATNIAFSDGLDDALSGLAATGLPINDVCGAGSQLTGTGVISLTGGTLPPEGTCTFSVTLQVPGGAPAGVYTNTTSALTFDRGGSPVIENTATDHLFVLPAPVLIKHFDDPVAAGDAVTLTFTISNTSPISSVTNIAFEDVFPVILPTATFVPSPGFCGTGSTATFTPLSDPQGGGSSTPAKLVVSGANLASGASCSFDLALDVASDAPNGIYPNITSNITGEIGGETVTGGFAIDNLEIVAAPQLAKSFTDDPVLPGGTVTLEFSLSHSTNASSDATDISFTDDLNATLPGLAATGLPASDVCGAGSQIDGTGRLNLTGGNLAPGASCTFSITLQVPAGVPSGSHTNTTSNITATVAGLTVAGNPASDALDIPGLTLTKEFTDDPAIPSDTVTLEFNLVNASTVHTATNIYFQDDLASVLSGLAATDLPKNDICGAGSSLSASAGDKLITFQGGTLNPGDSCTFSTILQVPAGAASDTYANATSDFAATIDGSTVPLTNASDELVVSDQWLGVTKSFTDDPVAPGETATLEFTVENLHATESVTDVTFADDLTATLSGLAATGLPTNDVCGTGSQISGTDLLTFTGGNLSAGASCTFSVILQVPAGAAFGTYDNATSEITGDIGGFEVKGEPATGDLQVADLVLTKAFDGPTVAGGTVNLEFTVENLGTSATVGGISFSDDLDAVVPGLVATSLPPDDFCGGGSRLTGTSVLSMSNGLLGPSASCTFSVTLQVPAGAAPGDFLNTTSYLLSSDLPVGDPATATLTIEPPPAFDKSFAPNPIILGFTSTLTFSIDNTASSLAASGLDFTDHLPTGLVVATPPNASTTCTGGTLTANAGSGTIAYGGGTVGAGASCTVQVDVIGSSAGTHVNTTGDLTSSSGNSGTADDSMTVYNSADLGVIKSDSPDPVVAGQTLTYTLTVANGGPHEATGVVVTDALPAEFTPQGNTCGASGTPLIWNVGTLSPNDSYTCTITGTIDTGANGIITNTVAVSSDALDPQSANDTASETTLVLGKRIYLPLIAKEYAQSQPGSLVQGQSARIALDAGGQQALRTRLVKRESLLGTWARFCRREKSIELELG
jgi:uncharacterized repeat protein (TIGR01451 family)